MKYGDRIAILREKSALTQEELANKLGISRASLSHYENNRREPDFNTTLKIANFFSKFQRTISLEEQISLILC